MRMVEVRRAWNDLPLVGLDEMLQGRVPLILAPHPDDESIGCGGLIAQLCAAGTPPHVVILTDGCHSHPNSKDASAGAAAPSPGRTRRGRRCCCWACRMAAPGSSGTWIPGFRARGPSFQFAARRIAGICEQQGCNIIFSTWRHDPHCDHVAAATLAEHVAAREGIPLMSYPVWGWTLSDDTEGGRAAAARLPPRHHRPDRAETEGDHDPCDAVWRPDRGRR